MDGTWKCGHGMGIWRWMAGLKVSGIFLHWTHHLSYLRAVWGVAYYLHVSLRLRNVFSCQKIFYFFWPLENQGGGGQHLSHVVEQSVSVLNEAYIYNRP